MHRLLTSTSNFATDGMECGRPEGLTGLRTCATQLGTWPTAENVVAELAAALRVAADEAYEPEEKGRLGAAADALTGFARDVSVAVVARHVGG